MTVFWQVVTNGLQLGVVNWKDRNLCRKWVSCFCSRVESLQLPDWLTFSKGKESQNSVLDDDFVLPEMEISANKTSGLKVEGHWGFVKTMTQDSAEADADKVRNILRASFMSPGEVVRAVGECSVKVSKELVDKILKRLSNDWKPAFGFFLWADTQIGYKHSAEHYDMMVDILGKCKQFDLMWGLVEEMKQAGGIVSLVTMTKVMRRLAGAGRWGDTIDTFRALEHFGIKRDTASMNVLLDTLCKERSVKHAREAFLEFRNEIPPNATSFNMLVHGWCKARKIEAARMTMIEMREFGLSPCVITYTSLIEAYCLENDFQMVYAILDEMHMQGCSPNIVTYTIVMHSLGKANKTLEALKIFDKVKDDGCVPDTSFYNSLIYILCKAGQVQGANDVYEEMFKNGAIPNVTTYNTLISAYCSLSQENNALKLLLKMEETSCNPNIKTYAPLLKLCCRSQLIKILLYLLGHMFRKDISPDSGTYTLLINGLCRNRKLVQSCVFFKEMVLKGSTPYKDTYDKLLEALEREKMYDAKEKIQQLMMHAQNMRLTGKHSLHEQQSGCGEQSI